jgi:hypothetical protein
LNIKRLLSERQRAIGLSVPGMPIGAPGIEVGKKQGGLAQIAGPATAWAASQRLVRTADPGPPGRNPAGAFLH